MFTNLNPNNRWIQASATSSVPAWGCVAPVSIDAAERSPLKVKKPDAGTVDGPLFFNDGRVSASNDHMRVTADFPCWALYSGTAPAIGDELVPVPGQHYLEVEEGGPFNVVALNPGSNSVVYVSRSGSRMFIIRFELTATTGIGSIILSRSAGVNKVPEEVAGKVDVVDMMNCLNFQIGLRGYAAYMTSDTGTGTGTGTGATDVNQWEVFSLCCP